MHYLLNKIYNELENSVRKLIRIDKHLTKILYTQGKMFVIVYYAANNGYYLNSFPIDNEYYLWS